MFTITDLFMWLMRQHSSTPDGDICMYPSMQTSTFSCTSSKHLCILHFIDLYISHCSLYSSFMERVKWSTNYHLRAGYQQQHGSRTREGSRIDMRCTRWPLDDIDVWCMADGGLMVKMYFDIYFVKSLYSYMKVYALVAHFFTYKNIWWIHTLFLWIYTFRIYSRVILF